jgi:hypothetical protein
MAESRRFPSSRRASAYEGGTRTRPGRATRAAPWRSPRVPARRPRTSAAAAGSCPTRLGRSRPPPPSAKARE